MAIIKDRESAFDFLNSPIILTNSSEFSDNFLIELFLKKYGADLLKLDFFNDDKFYFCVEKDLLKLFDGRNFDQKKQFAIALLECLKNEYCNYELTSALEWLISAIIHIGFINLKDDTEKFCHAFSLFDVRGGRTESFCRFVIVARLENFCRLQYNDTLEHYRYVFRFDGEPVKDNRYLLERTKYILNQLWQHWCPNCQKCEMIKCLYAFLRINNYSKELDIKSAYWVAREKVR